MIYGNSVLTEETRNMLILGSEIDNFSKITESEYLVEFSFEDIIDKILGFFRGIREFIKRIFKSIKAVIDSFFNRNSDSSDGTAKKYELPLNVTYYKADELYNSYIPNCNKFLDMASSTSLKPKFQSMINTILSIIKTTKDTGSDVDSKFVEDEIYKYERDCTEIFEKFVTASNSIESHAIDFFKVDAEVTTIEQAKSIIKIIDDQNIEKIESFVEESEKKTIGTIDLIEASLKEIYSKAKADIGDNKQAIKAFNVFVTENKKLIQGFKVVINKTYNFFKLMITRNKITRIKLLMASSDD